MKIRKIQERYGIQIISIVIVFILVTQLIAGLVNTGKWGWPFLAYPMYSTAHYDGERVVYDVKVYGVLKDLSRIELKRSDLGMDFWVFRYNVVQPIRHGYLSALSPIIDLLCRQNRGDLIRLEYEDMGVAISRTGLVYGLEPVVVESFDVSCK